MKYAVFPSPSSNTGDHTIGDVALGDDGKMYAVTLDNSGNTCWTCIDDGNISSVIVSLLRTIKWSVMMSLQQKVDMLQCIEQNQKKQVKRKKTAYNKHIGNVLKELSKTHPTMPRKQRMQIAVNSWKDVKDKSALLEPDCPSLRVTPNLTPPLAPEGIHVVSARGDGGADQGPV